MNKSESIKEIAAALVGFNSEVSKIAKDASNPFFKNNYATLDNIIDEVRPILTKHGLNIMQFPSSDGQTVSVTTYLLHTSGEFLESEPLSMKPVKSDPQGVGSCISYARRYSLQAFLSLNTGSDDDGNNASGKQAEKKPAPQKNTNAMTVRQKDEILKKATAIAKKSGVEMKDVWTTVQQHFKFDKSLVQLTNSEASKVIEYLISQE